MTARRVVWADIAPDEIYPGVERQIVDGERQTLIRYVYQPGAVFPVHSHPEEQITAVLTGRIRFTISGEPVILSAGEAAVIPPNVPHGAAVLGDEAVETLNTLSPRRARHP